MSKRSTRKSQPAKVRNGIWKDPLGLVKALSAPLGAALLGALAFWFEPARDVVRHWFWEEKVTLELAINPGRIRAGDEFDISIIGRPLSQIPVGQGILKLEIPPEIQLISGSPVIPVETFAQPRRLEGKEPLRAWALKDGSPKIRATFETQYGRYNVGHTVVIHPTTGEDVPSKINFSGRWSVTLGPNFGYMIIVERHPHRNFTGEYIIGTEKGVLEGHRDGISFEASLFRKLSPTRWQFTAVKPDQLPEGSLEFKGVGTLQEFRDGSWVNVQQPLPLTITAR